MTTEEANANCSAFTGALAFSLVQLWLTSVSLKDEQRSAVDASVTHCKCNVTGSCKLIVFIHHAPGVCWSN